MSRSSKHRGPVKILVVDIGGTHIKCLASGRKVPARIASGPGMTPRQMIPEVLSLTRTWHYDVVSIGYPGVVKDGKIQREPCNLGNGWIGFDFEAAFGCPVRILNDAAMQALGGYEGGTMLFLGLGTGLGSALIVDGVIAAMELGHLHCGKHHTYEYYLGNAGRHRLGNRKWRSKVNKVIKGIHAALLPDYVLVGGGNAARLKSLPENTRRGDNSQAYAGGFRLWETPT